jgi:aminomethyltransferase
MDQELRRTPFFDHHVAAGARIVPFAGFEMPVQYSGVKEEHLATRSACGLFDVSHMGEIRVRGPKAEDALMWLLSNAIRRLEVGQAQYNAMCNPDGGVVDDVFVYREGADDFLVCVNAANRAKDFQWMVDHDREGAEIVDEGDQWAQLAIQGPAAVEVVRLLAPAEAPELARHRFLRGTFAGIDDCIIARTGYTGEDGFEIILPAEEAPAFWKSLYAAGVAPAGLGARDTLRLEAGMNLYGQDMDESTSPLESGLNWTVDLKSERDFIGKQALLDSNPTQQLAGLVLLDRGVLRSHQKVVGQVNGQAFEGEITSGGFSPTINQSIALARIAAGVSPGDEVHVLVRDKQLRAKVVKYPFVRNGKVLI